MSGLFDRLQDEIDSREEPGGLSPVDLLGLPPSLATVIQKIIRRNGLRLDQIAAELDQTPAETQKALDELVDKGYVRRGSKPDKSSGTKPVLAVRPSSLTLAMCGLL